MKAYSVIIPTMWVNKIYLDYMLRMYEKSAYISEVIIIDNDPANKMENIQWNKVKIYTQGKNIFVNPAWNWGVTLAASENVIIANDDILVTGLDKLLEYIDDILTENMIIGPSKTCLDDRVDSLPIKIEKVNDDVLPQYWGTFMIMNKKSYRVIPDHFKIWCGDDILFHANDSYIIKEGIQINTQMSETITRNRLEGMCNQEFYLYNHKCNKDGSFK